MKKNSFYCCIFFAMVAMAFCACGDGSVEARGGEDELALLNYGPPFVEGDTGNMWTLRNNAIKDCEADDVCKAAMENADGELDIPEEESSSSEDTPAESSDSVAPRSSANIAKPTSVATVISTVSSDSQGGSGDVPETSSASVATSSNSSIAGVVLRYCQPAGGVRGPTLLPARRNRPRPFLQKRAFIRQRLPSTGSQSPLPATS